MCDRKKYNFLTQNGTIKGFILLTRKKIKHKCYVNGYTRCIIKYSKI